MVNALLDGTKTQTRRIAKLNVAGRVEKCGRNWHVEDAAAVMACPYGEPGDSLWVRESFRKIMGDTHGWIETDYRATYQNGYRLGDTFAKPKWTPSIHMPRAASRITIKITDVRLEPLINISPEDATAEGWPGPDADNSIRSSYPIGWYAHLWDQINGKTAPWVSNPWVWVVCFQVVGSRNV
jgi:hypothetical protein